jgi:hypothetical protein
MPDEFKGTVFRENRMGDHKLACAKIYPSKLILDQNQKILKSLFSSWIGLNDQKDQLTLLSL